MTTSEILLASTDWLGRKTIFYNDRNFSTNINDLVETEFEWDREGLYHYLDWGMSVFFHTPVKGIRFLPPNHDLVREESGKLKAVARPEPDWLNVLNTPSRPDDVLHKIEDCIHKREKNSRGNIILPLSGGYDSRLIALMIKDKKRIKAFSYGLSKNQAESFEAVYAQEIARRLNISWRRIELGEYNKYIPDWYERFGASTHAHGMYHIEFYKKIREDNVVGPLLSGLVGDLWAGKSVFPVNHSNELGNLKLTHGVAISGDVMKFKPSSFVYAQKYYEEKRELLRDSKFCVLELIRHKMILLNYLEIIPESMGFEVFSPFCEQEVALAMLALPEDLRKARKWQVDFFRKNDLYPEDQFLKCDYRNDLNRQAWHKSKTQFELLDSRALADIVNPNYVEWVNSRIRNPPSFFKYHFRHNLKLLADRFRVGRWFGFTMHEHLKPYLSYLILYPLHRLALKRMQKQS